MTQVHPPGLQLRIRDDGRLFAVISFFVSDTMLAEAIL